MGVRDEAPHCPCTDPTEAGGPGANATRPSAHAHLAVIPRDGTSPRPCSRPAAAKVAPMYVCRCAIPSPAWTQFQRFPNVGFASKLIQKIISGKTKQNKAKQYKTKTWQCF